MLWQTVTVLVILYKIQSFYNQVKSNLNIFNVTLNCINFNILKKKDWLV